MSTSARLTPMPGPIPDPAGAYDLAALGYTEQEFLLEGTRQPEQCGFGAEASNELHSQR